MPGVLKQTFLHSLQRRKRDLLVAGLLVPDSLAITLGCGRIRKQLEAIFTTTSQAFGVPASSSAGKIPNRVAIRLGFSMIALTSRSAASSGANVGHLADVMSPLTAIMRVLSQPILVPMASSISRELLRASSWTLPLLLDRLPKGRRSMNPVEPVTK